MATEALEVRIARLEGAYEQIDRRLSSIEERLGRIEARIDSVFWRFAALLFISWGSLMATILFKR